MKIWTCFLGLALATSFGTIGISAPALVTPTQINAPIGIALTNGTLSPLNSPRPNQLNSTRQGPGGAQRPNIHQPQRLNSSTNQTSQTNQRTTRRSYRGLIKLAIWVVIGVVALGGWFVRKLAVQ